MREIEEGERRRKRFKVEGKKKRKLSVNIEIKSGEREKQLIKVYGRRGGEELKDKKEEIKVRTEAARQTITVF